jgi:hypothetical protein
MGISEVLYSSLMIPRSGKRLGNAFLVGASG